MRELDRELGKIYHIDDYYYLEKIINDGDISNISKVRFIFKIKLEYIK